MLRVWRKVSFQFSYVFFGVATSYLHICHVYEGAAEVMHMIRYVVC